MSSLITITTTLPKEVADLLATLAEKLRVPRSSLIRDLLTVESIEAWAQADTRVQQLELETARVASTLSPWEQRYGVNSTRLLRANDEDE